ncbi:hypothetical protein [Filimonas effusa]|uniref:Uncharacterized protein n=1 Tax=Filimonas effusa TaxID=2508721 RepID=A0A4Q1DBG8_9BACT|nr:hypothetical protein [Filimonas effusa]RXK86777.1 hypothetical protein ESB13_08255 [Filimonas effusa]
MKLKLNILILLAFVGAVSCRKEEVTQFPDYDQNWLVVNDNPADPATHSSYLFFKETGIPLYFNDTIGSQQRVDVFGNTYTHYEKLSFNYSLGGIQVGAPPMVNSFTYCAKSDVPAAIDFLKNNIIPVLPKGVYVPSILLVENLSSYAFGQYAFKGFNTVLIGKVSTIPGMSATVFRSYKAAILRAIFTNAVLNDKYSALLTSFYNESRKYSTIIDTYNLGSWTFSYNINGLPAGVTPSFNALGFLGSDPRNSSYTPYTTWMDVSMFLEAAFSNSKADFQRTYGSYTSIMKKYGIITQILENIGYKVQ